MFRRTRAVFSRMSNRISSTNHINRTKRLYLQALEDRAVPATITVTNDQDTIAVDGTVSIREALDSINAGASVNADVVAVGAYGTADAVAFSGVVGPINLSSGQLNISKVVSITGPGSGLLTVQNGFGASTTSRIFNDTLATGTVAISGLTLTGGQVTGANNGGAVVMTTTGNLTLTDVTITGNSTAGEGGGISNQSTGTLTMVNCTVSSNTATGSDGGGINNQSTGALSLTGTTVSGNIASNDGGAIYVNSSLSLITIVNSTFSGNTAAGRGGAIYFTGPLAGSSITGSTFSSNITTAGAGGGAIYCTSGTLSIATTTISGNSSFAVGGGIRTAGPLTVTNCTISGNTSNTTGGGINSSSTLNITQSTIANNTSTTTGGGINMTAGVATIVGATISGNFGTTVGGGINVAGGTLNLTSSIVGGNTDAGTGPDVKGTIATNSFDLIGNTTGITFTGGQAASTKVGAPNLGALASNGGPTQTMIPNVGSLAIDNGTVSYPSQRFDQRGAGFTRSYAVPDIGAAEYVPTGFPSASVNAADMTVVAPTYNFSVDYYDDVGVDTNTLNTGDISITGGPGTFSSIAFVNFTGSGTKITANYSATPTVAITGVGYNGTYTVNIVGSQVSDGTNFIPAGANVQFKINVPSTYVVNSTLDETTDTDGKLSLREAIGLANLATNTVDTITFDGAVFTAGTVYTLTKGVGTITDSLVITGPGVANLSVSGASTNQTITINSGLTVSVSGMEFKLFAGTGVGGVFTNAGANVTLTNVNFTNNKTSSTTGGGAIGLTAATSKVTLDGCVLVGNSVTGSGGDGGVIRATTSSTISVINSTFTGNTAADDGGAIYSTGGNVSIIGSTFNGNFTTKAAGNDGGALTYTGTVPTTPGGGFVIRNSTFSGNSASSGGAMLLSSGMSGTATFTNTTFTLNGFTSATGNGGAINRQGGTLVFESVIMSGNISAAPPANGPDLFSAATVTMNTSAIGTSTGFTVGSGSANFIGTPVSLGALANNGGPTQTHLPASGSFVRNNGSNPAALTTDQTGANRTLQLFSDIGAVESVDIAPVFHMTAIPAITTPGATPNQIVVTYSDDNAIDYTSIGTADLVITAPNLSTLTITGATVDVMADGPNRVATYTFTPPGGSWDGADFGTYTVSVAASQVADKDGTVHFVSAGAIGSFFVGIPANFVVDNTGDVNDGNYSAGNFTLREAVALANLVPSGFDTITFGGAAFAGPATITLTAELPINGNLTITGTGTSNLTISGNNTVRIFNYTDATQVATFNLNNLRLFGGKATASGGGAILNSTGETLNITNCVVEGNTATAGNGGAIVLPLGGAVTIASSSFINNATTASTPGGAIDGNANGGSLTVTDSTFSGNKATGSRGGAISVATFTTSISRSTFSGNSAANGGALSFYGTVSSTIANSTISSNTATTSGGGIQMQSGGVATLFVRNSTITANTATVSGGGIARTTGTWSINLYSTIVYGNLGGTTVSPDLFTALDVVANFSSIGDITGVTTFTPDVTTSNLLGQNPLLGPLQNNGGPTLTHALLPGTPVLNMGDNAIGMYTTDQRGAGFPRVLAGTPDIGAFEGIDASPAGTWTPIGPIVTPGATPNTIDVSWADDTAINWTTLGVDDITIKAPNGSFLTITSAVPSQMSNGTPISVTYTFTVPGGAWGNTPDSGVYTVSTVSGKVADTGGSFNKATTLGTFVVDLPANYVVDNNGDTNDGNFAAGQQTLREALFRAAQTTSTDTITFAPGIVNILLGSELAIAEAVTITGPGSSKLTVSGNNVTRVFNISTPAQFAVISISGMTITGGSASTDGGGITMADEDVTLTDVIVTGNKTTTEGGGINVSTASGKLTLIDCVVSNNQTGGAGNDGGGINFDTTATSASDQTLTMKRTTLSGNVSGDDGGGVYFFSGGSCTIDDSTISGNTCSADDGGGLYLFGTTTTITNSTLANNKAADAGGAVAALSTTNLTVNNSTIVGNSGGASGGGGIGKGTGTPVVTLNSTIVAKNTAPTGADIAATATIDYCFIGIDSGATLTDVSGKSIVGTGSAIDPVLGALGNNGGPTLTMLPLFGSPVIKAGSNPFALTEDQRGTGFPRELTVGMPNIGAVEGFLSAPSAVMTPLGPIVTAGPTPDTIVVTYSDDVAVNVSTIDINDIQILNPSLVPLSILSVSVNINTNGSPRVATYKFAVPGGGWDFTDNGTYTVNMNASQVSDTDPQFVAAGNLGKFNVSFPVTYLVDEATDVNDGVFTAGKLSLREAIALANADTATSIINFSGAVFGSSKTISVGSDMAITEPVTINAPAAMLTLSAGAAGFRAFSIDLSTSGDTVSLAGMTVTGFSPASGDGGAIDDQDAALTLTGMAFSKNTAPTNGGAVNMELGGTSLTVVNCIFDANTATGGDGGAIFQTVSNTVTIDKSVISNNVAASTSGDGGGLMLSGGGTLVITNSTISGNTANNTSASFGGGGVYGNATIVMTFTNCTIAGNTAAGGGGGIHVDDTTGTLNLNNCTVAYNSSNASGGGINLRVGGVANIVSSIISNNAATTAGPDVFGPAAGTVNIDSSNISNSAGITVLNQTGVNLVDVDPLIGTLSNNGGFTLPGGSTVPTIALKSGSPAIDAGSNPLSLTTDERGGSFVRVFGGTADMGAFEVQPVVAAKVTGVSINSKGIDAAHKTQRSRVTDVAITFDSKVTFTGTPEAAFSLTKVGGGSVTVTAGVDNTGPGTVVTLTFSGAGTDFTSLADGRYALHVLNAGLTGGLVGGDFIFDEAAAPAPLDTAKIFRLFGDYNGDGTVAANDFIQFRLNLGGNDTIFDFDNDGAVAASDFIQFRLRFGGSI